MSLPQPNQKTKYKAFFFIYGVIIEVFGLIGLVFFYFSHFGPIGLLSVLLIVIGLLMIQYRESLTLNNGIEEIQISIKQIKGGTK